MSEQGRIVTIVVEQRASSAVDLFGSIAKPKNAAFRKAALPRRAKNGRWTSGERPDAVASQIRGVVTMAGPRITGRNRQEIRIGMLCAPVSGALP